MCPLVPRIYCYICSGDSKKRDNETRKHQSIVLKKSVKLQAIRLLDGKFIKCELTFFK